MEKRSTCAPISAILMTAESPARPPPITIIFGAAIVPLSAFCELLVDDHGSAARGGSRSGRLLWIPSKCSQAGQPSASEHEEECQAYCEKSLPCLFPGNDARLRAEQP